jgi:antitoxin ChpS
MLAPPPAILDLLHLQAGATVGIAVEGRAAGRRAACPPSPQLADLLAQGDAAAAPGDENRAWLNAGSAGREPL